MVTSLLLALLTATSAGAAPHLKLEGKYEQLNGPCKAPVAIGGKHLGSSVAECEQECDKQAAAAPGTGHVGLTTHHSHTFYVSLPLFMLPLRCLCRLAREQYHHFAERETSAALPC